MTDNAKQGFQGAYILLYQVGIANVFRYADLQRVRQGDYRQCEHFSRGLIEAGKRVVVMHLDVAGDVAL